MSSAFDPRIVQVTITFPDEILTFEGLSIYASGQKFQAAIFNQCDCRIFNLTKEQRNYILSKTSPFNISREPILMTLDVGRQSYGTFRLFDGYVRSSGCTQPPDIGISLIALTSSFLTGTLTFDTQSSIAQLSVIAKNIADKNGLILDFQATDKQIANFRYDGAVAYMIKELNTIGGVIASSDGGVLTVVDPGKPNKKGSRIISAETGMVGIPQFIERGLVVKMMIDNTVQIGNMVTVQSKQVPAANGDYIVQKILFDVASRDQQFYYTLFCIPPQYDLGTIS